jgi:hypothetical protein
VAKVKDVVGLYLAPPEHAIVLSVDEKTSIQALERTQLPLPLRSGRARRHTHDYSAARRLVHESITVALFGFVVMSSPSLFVVRGSCCLLREASAPLIAVRLCEPAIYEGALTIFPSRRERSGI